MTAYLRVQDGVAVEPWTAPTGLNSVELTPADCFVAALAATFHPAGEAAIGWTWDGTAFAPAVAPAPSAAALSAYAAGALSAIFAQGKTFNVAASGSTLNVLCDGTNDTRSDLAMLALFGQESVNGTKTWVDNNGVSTVLTGAQLVTLTILAGTWISDLYAALGAVLTGIGATPPTITTTAEIDAAFAAVIA